MPEEPQTPIIDEVEMGAEIVDEILVKLASLKPYQLDDTMTLAALHLSNDARTIEEMVADEEQHEYVIEKVETPVATEDGYQTVSFDNGLTGAFRIPDDLPPIEVGDTIIIYSIGPVFGGIRRGFSINGKLYQYDTPWEVFANRMKMLAEHDRKNRERANAERAQVDQWLEDLEGPFKRRILRFREQDPTFDMQGGTYETYPCLIAQRITKYVAFTHGWKLDRETFKVAGVEVDEMRAGIEAFRKMDQVKQRDVIHAGKEDDYGISGHQFDFACGMALNAMREGNV